MATPAEIYDDRLPTIALVGRVNVGKSTLFNKLIEEQKAIVSDVPGTTRTSNEGVILWRGKEINVIDTGGLTFSDDVPLEDDILRQSEYAMDRADIIVLVTDAKIGILPQEREIAKRLRKLDRPVMVLANKADTAATEREVFDAAWFQLGLGEPMAVSAASGKHVGDFLDEVYKTLQKGSIRPKKAKAKRDDITNIAIIGKPNVGKSSLFNKLIGQEKVIVSDMAHTTREPHNTLLVYEHPEGKKTKKYNFNFVDTAGIRRKAKVKGQLERAGIFKSIDAIDDADIILFVLDGTEPISHQDLQLGGLLQRHGKSVIILLNKWDLSEDNSDHQRHDVEKMVRSYFPHLDFAPILLVSGLTGYSVHKVFPELIRVWNGRQTQIPVKTLEYFLKKATEKHRPARGKGTRHPKLMGIRQIATAPPVFEIFVKYRTSLHRSYVHFLENRLREQFDFTGTPIIIKLVKMKRQ